MPLFWLSRSFLPSPGRGSSSDLYLQLPSPLLTLPSLSSPLLPSPVPPASMPPARPRVLPPACPQGKVWNADVRVCVCELMQSAAATPAAAAAAAAIAAVAVGTIAAVAAAVSIYPARSLSLL
ncbi:unnamed protein product [Closterium sp. NIES-53]